MCWILWETLVKQVEPAHRKLKVRRRKRHWISIGHCESVRAGGRQETPRGEIQSLLLRGLRDSSEIKKLTIIRTVGGEGKKERIGGEGDGEKKLLLFHLSGKKNDLQHQTNPVSNPRFSSY